jgi:hypothetical protein
VKTAANYTNSADIHSQENFKKLELFSPTLLRGFSHIMSPPPPNALREFHWNYMTRKDYQ